jgi:large subunit ribosomal protein L9e
MPRPVLTSDFLKIENPEVNITVKAGVVTVTGPRGVLSKDLSALKLDFDFDAAERKLNARCWLGNRKQVARIGTLFGHVKNMITGVTVGYRYKMRFVTSHFPIKHTINADKTEFSYTHFMGKRHRMQVAAAPGVTIRDGGVKDEIYVEGNCLDDVAQTAGRIHQSANIRDKDLRKFLDGIYVSEKTHLVEA